MSGRGVIEAVTARQELNASVLGSVLPFVLSAILVVAGAVVGSLTILCLGLLGMATFLPIGPDLWRRALAALVGVTGLVGTASLFPGFTPGWSGFLVLLAVAVVAVLLTARSLGWPRAVPHVTAADVLVMVASGLVGLALLSPLIGRSSEQVLLDVALRHDNLPHFLSVGAVLGDVARATGADYGFHVLVALGLVADPGGAIAASSVSVTGYAVLTGVIGAVCAGALGFLTVGIANSMSGLTPWARRWGPAAAIMAFLIWALLSGAFATYHLVGHLNFLLAVVVVCAASWLALEASARGQHGSAGLITLMGVLASLSIYRSTQVGLAAVAALVTWRWLGDGHQLSRNVRGALSLGVSFLVFAGWLPFHYYAIAHIPVMASASVAGIGAVLAVPPTTVLVTALVAVLALYLAVRRFGSVPGLLPALAPAAGFVAFASIIALEVLRRGQPLDNYYIWKVAAAASLSLVPVAMAAGVVALGPRPGARTARGVIVGVGMLAVLVALPSSSTGGPAVPEGVAIWKLRAAWMDGAGTDGARMLEAAQALEQSSKVPVVLADRDWGWGYRPQMASRWLAALRGVRLPRAAPQECLMMEGGALDSCLVEWVEVQDQVDIIIVDARCAVSSAELDVLRIGPDC